MPITTLNGKFQTYTLKVGENEKGWDFIAPLNSPNYPLKGGDEVKMYFHNRTGQMMLVEILREGKLFIVHHGFTRIARDQAI